MILDHMVKQRRFFNEKSKEDIEMARGFFREHKWGLDGCPFLLEYPYMSIPDMIKDKLVHKSLGLEFDRRHHMVGTWS